MAKSDLRTIDRLALGAIAALGMLDSKGLV